MWLLWFHSIIASKFCDFICGSWTSVIPRNRCFPIVSLFGLLELLLNPASIAFQFWDFIFLTFNLYSRLDLYLRLYLYFYIDLITSLIYHSFLILWLYLSFFGHPLFHVFIASQFCDFIGVASTFGIPCFSVMWLHWRYLCECMPTLLPDFVTLLMILRLFWFDAIIVSWLCDFIGIAWTSVILCLHSFLNLWLYCCYYDVIISYRPDFVTLFVLLGLLWCHTIRASWLSEFTCVAWTYIIPCHVSFPIM